MPVRASPVLKVASAPAAFKIAQRSLFPNSRFRPLYRLQRCGMDFDKTGVAQQIQNCGPEPYQQTFEIRLADIPQTNPDHFGRRALQHDAIKKIGVTGENGPVALTCMNSQQMIACLRPEVGGVRTLDWQETCKRDRQVFVDEQVLHEASRTVERAALSRRAYSMHASTSSRPSCGWALRMSSIPSPAPR